MTRREAIKSFVGLAAVASTPVGVKGLESNEPDYLPVDLFKEKASGNMIYYTRAMDRADKRTSITSGHYANSGNPVYDKGTNEFTKEMDYSDKRTRIA